MSGLIIVPNYMPALDTNARPIPGALMWFYLNETTTLTTVYTDAALTVPATNPVVADSSGVFSLLYGPDSTAYSVAVTTSTGAPIVSYDNVLVSVGLGDPTIANVEDYGARSGSSAYTAINNLAFAAAAATGKQVVIPYRSGGFWISQVQATVGVQWIGVGRRPLIYFTGASAWDIMPFESGVSYIQPVRFQNLTINGNSGAAGSIGIRPRTDLGNIFNVRIEGMNFVQCEGAVGDVTSASNYVVDFFITDVRCAFTRGTQFYFNRSRGFFVFEDVAVDHTYNSGQVTWGGFDLNDGIGIELRACDVVGPVTPTNIYQATAVGMRFTEPFPGGSSLWLTRCLIDNTRGPAFIATYFKNVFMVNCEAYQNLGIPFYFTLCTTIQGSNTVVRGGHGLTGAAAASSGITFDQCSSFQMANTRTDFNTGNGIVRANSTDGIFTGLTSTDNDALGLLDTGTSNRNIIMGATFARNAGAHDATILGAGSITMGYVNGLGAATASLIGAGNIN